MFANKVVRSFARNNQVKRYLSQASFKPQSTKDVWLGDSGAYPIMGIITGAALMGISATAYLFLNTPDARIDKRDRKNLFRGEFMKESREVQEASSE
mmetsp:Transcript_83763/g.233622  ORF Transcript_83763/g.233622 Transcript_83763/m.233622 type:complete len:97 (-) Transcript_83763:141-431(-)